jgi:hypothetical protein
MGRLLPVVKPLVDLLDRENDETLFKLFDECVKSAAPLPGVPEEVRGTLALLQIFGEANADRRHIQLAREAIERHQQYDVYHFAAVALNHKGRHASGTTGEALLKEAIDLTRRGEALPGASDTASYALRQSTYALANFSLGNINLARGHSADAHFHEALRRINLRRPNGQVLGYQAQILLALNQKADACVAAMGSLAKRPGGLDASEVLLRTASNDIFNECFVPYTKLQAVCCSLAHAPMVNETHRTRVMRGAVIPFLLREGVMPMAYALDPDAAEAAHPGAAASCRDAYRGRKRIRCRVDNRVIECFVDVWAWEADHPRTVVGIEELGIFARGRTLDLAASHFGRVIGHRRPNMDQLRQHALPLDIRIASWVEGHADGEPQNTNQLVRDITQHYYHGRQQDAWAVLQTLEPTATLLPSNSHREYQRLRAWVGAEVGELEALTVAHDLLEYQTPTLCILTDLQKAGAARGFTPHPIVEGAHEVVEARRLAENEHFFAPIERLYYSIYLLSVGRNAEAESMLTEALESEMRGPAQARVIARIADMLSEALRRRGELDLARRIIQENIEKRQAQNICIAPSLVQSAKCADAEELAYLDILKAIELYGECNRKEQVRALVLEARMVSDPEWHAAIHERVIAEAAAVPALTNDVNLNRVLSNWPDWCRPSFCPELDYWNL